MLNNKTKKIGWGIIGCGDIAEKSGASSIRDSETSRLVAIMRRDPEEAKDTAEKLGVERYYTDVHTLLEDKEVDAVYIATPVYLHAPQTILAAEHGKHILCEKPMAMNIKECNRMLSACKKSNVKLSIAYYRRFFPQIIKAKEIVSQGKIGKPILLRAHCNFWCYLTPGEPKAWRLIPELGGGGVLMDIGSHRIDLLIYFGGQPISACGYIDTLVQNWQVEDTASLLINFENGTQGILSATYASKASSDCFEIYGSEGMIDINNLGGTNIEVTIGNNSHEITVESVEPKHRHLPLVENLVRSIRFSSSPLCSGEEGLKTNWVMDACYSKHMPKRRI